jgi:type III restriction enzyme
MELILKEGLPHQQTAINAISNVFNDNCINMQRLYYSNPIIEISNAAISDNISKIQSKVNPENRGNDGISGYLNLDIKMETGTGRTS